MPHRTDHVVNKIMGALKTEVRLKRWHVAALMVAVFLALAL